MVNHTKGPWRKSKRGGAVVADHPVPEIGGSDAVDYYGGHLIAESIAPQNVPVVLAAPDLLVALKRVLPHVGVGYSAKQRHDLLKCARAAIAKADDDD